MNIKNKLILAPMINVTHSPFRQLVSDLGGVSLFISELNHLNHILHQRKENLHWLKFKSMERPFFYQISGSNLKLYKKVIDKLLHYKPDGFDINMACPNSVITRKGSGLALMKDISLAQTIVKLVIKESRLPVSAKIRLGEREDKEYLKDFSLMLESSGIWAITLHPRTGKEYRKRKSRWKYIAYIKDIVKIPVIGNGDIKNSEDIREGFKETGCDAIMIGRAAITKPWIFRQYIEPDFYPDKKYYFFKFLALIKQLPAELCLNRIKIFTYYYSQNFKFGFNFYVKIKNAKTLEEINKIANDFFNNLF